MSDLGYIDYYEILGLSKTANPGEVRKTYRRKMKELVNEIARVEITADRRQRYLLDMAKFNAALYILRDKEKRDLYESKRQELIDLEEQWRAIPEEAHDKADALRREFDAKSRNFLSTYMEEAMLEAGLDKECVDASHWDAAHERHASNLLRHYRHLAYHKILERLPYYEVTPPDIDWSERAAFTEAILDAEAS